MPDMGAPHAEQLPLLPDEPLAFALEVVALDSLPPDDLLIGQDPDPKLVESIRHLGILQPVLLARNYDGAVRVAEGKRRVKAARAAGLTALPAWVTHVDGPLPDALTLITHAQRHHNPAADLHAIERLLALGFTEGQIARETGLPIATVRRLRRLGELHPDLRAALDRGGIATGVAEEATKLPWVAQARLARRLAQVGRLTATDVEAERHVRTHAALVNFPFALVAATPGAETASGEAEHLTSGAPELGDGQTGASVPLDALIDRIAAVVPAALGGGVALHRMGAGELALQWPDGVTDIIAIRRTAQDAAAPQDRAGDPGLMRQQRSAAPPAA